MAAVVDSSNAPPKWLDRNFLQKALREGLRRGSLDINSYSIKPATNPGDNYLSQMFRASANVVSRRKSAEDLSIVIKSLPRGDSAVNYCNEAQMFVKEMKMLSETLPLFNRLLNEIQEPKLSAELYYMQTEPEDILILEDLCRSGYQSVDRIACLDLESSKLVVERLALFHAASLAVLEKDPTLNDCLFRSFWIRENHFCAKFFTEAIYSVTECLKQWDILPDIREKFLSTSLEDFKEKLYAVSQRKDGEFMVLNHGDPWTSNIMFKLENQSATDLRFVDFQLTCENVPVYDLLYFHVTSTKLDVRSGKADELLETYYKKLNETCQKLSIPLKLTFSELQKMFYDKIFFGFFIFITLTPFMSVPSKDARDLSEFLDADETSSTPNLEMYLSQNFKKSCEVMLPFFDKFGVFD